MNLLLNGVPDHITVCDQAFFIKTDFRHWIRFETSMTKEKDPYKKMEIMLDLFIDEVPTDISFVEQLLWFYQCGVEERDHKQTAIENQRPVYDYDQDQYMIYTAFKQYYGIDLIQESMHWWIFKQMFLELPEDAKIKKVMTYRSIKINSNMSKEQRQFYTEMKYLYALPDERTKEEKARSFGAILANGMRIIE